MVLTYMTNTFARRILTKPILVAATIFPWLTLAAHAEVYALAGRHGVVIMHERHGLHDVFIHRRPHMRIAIVARPAPPPRTVVIVHPAPRVVVVRPAVAKPSPVVVVTHPVAPRPAIVVRPLVIAPRPVVVARRHGVVLLSDRRLVVGRRVVLLPPHRQHEYGGHPVVMDLYHRPF